MTAPDIALADDIVLTLNSQSFSYAFDAERVYVPDWDEKSELSSLQCAVWPEDPTADPWERDELLKSYPIAVAFAQRLQSKTRAELDSLCNLVTEVTDFLELTVFEVGGLTFANQGWESRLRFNMNSLDRHKHDDGSIGYTGIFASVFSFPYQLVS